MQDPAQLNRTLESLRTRLHEVNHAWTVDNYESLLRFYVHISPRLLDAERCGIFVVEPSTGRILSKVGTDLGESEIEAPMEGSVVGRVVSSGRCIIENDLEGARGFHRTAEAITGFTTRNMVCAPIKSVAGGRITGALQVLNKRRGAGFTPEDGRLVQEIADYLSMALDNILLNREIVSLSTELDRHVTRLRSAYLGDVPFVAESAAMRKTLEMVSMVSATPVNVVIQGENGTGKEVIARMIHEASERRDRPLVAVNCAAIPESLMESEFFGYEKGAFTGAVASRPGRFEDADGGTLFLDEVADLPVSVQPKFLRTLQDGEGMRLGGNRTIRYDLRIISASNRSLREEVARGRFREDLFYRLFAVEIVLPPLRARREDIVPLAVAFLADTCRRYRKAVPGFSGELLALFESAPWPGNVRQLRHEVERLVALTPAGQELTPERCSPEVAGARPPPPGASLGGGDLNLPARVEALERRLIERALEQCKGNKLRAAALLGITRQGLHKKLKRYAEADRDAPRALA